MLHKLYKTKQFPLLIIKLAVVSLAFWFIAEKIVSGEADFMQLSEQRLSALDWFIILLISCTSWFFEIKKWHVLAAEIKPLSFGKAANQSLSSFTASIFTPNRIGEYGAKSLFYPKKERKKVFFLNFLSNLFQFSTTCIFGFLGMIYLSEIVELPYSKFEGSYFFVICLILIGIYLFFRFRKPGFLGKQFKRITTYNKRIKLETKLKLFFFALCRYLLFSHQFYLFLIFFNAEIGYFDAIFGIFTVFLFAAALPSVFFLEAVIKGSVALWIFSLFQVPEITILSSIGLMWIFNSGIPAMVGSYFVLKFKPSKWKTI